MVGRTKEYRWLSMCSREELEQNYEQALSRVGFSDTPSWKQWSYGTALGILIIAGGGTMIEILGRSSLFEQLLMLGGGAAGIMAWLLNRDASQRRELLEAICAERARREEST